MALNIKNPEADRLARELAMLTGESITDAVIAAMKDRIARERVASLRQGTSPGRSEPGRLLFVRPCGSYGRTTPVRRQRLHQD